MNQLPDFTSYGYQVQEKLNHNTQGGRITYKAINIKNQKYVIIKQFLFATSSDWDSYKAVEKESEVLQKLNHPGIPKYLEQFDPNDGLCLVQEYKNAKPLSKRRSFSPEEVKRIIVQLLEILVYLQAQETLIIHRDIKPENVLVDYNINVYLVDFGLARIGDQTIGITTMMGGTFGFMPPEQIYGKKLTEASDLYGLGATIICIITNTKSINIEKLVDRNNYRFDFKYKVPEYSFRFIEWLEKMVQPKPEKRYKNAKLALEELRTLYIFREPKIKLSRSEFNFVSKKIGEKISQKIRITNDVPQTTLQGKWSVSPHDSDPPHTPDRHYWINFSPRQFAENDLECTITVDTSKLKAEKSYQREIILNNNTRKKNIKLNILVKTANIYGNISWSFSQFIGFIITSITSFSMLYLVSWGSFLYLKNWLDYIRSPEVDVPIYSSIEQGIRGAYISSVFYYILFSLMIIGCTVWLISLSEYPINTFYNTISKVIIITWYLLLLLITTLLLGIISFFGFKFNLLAGLIISTLFLIVTFIGILIYPPLKLRQIKAQHRRRESKNLIEP